MLHAEGCRTCSNAVVDRLGREPGRGDGLPQGRHGRIVRPCCGEDERVLPSPSAQSSSGCPPELALPCRLIHRTLASSRMVAKPFCSAKAIWPAVTGEHEPETQAIRSAGGARNAAVARSRSPAARQWATSAYSTPCEPTAKSRSPPLLPDQAAGLAERLVVEHVEGHDLGAQRPLSVKRSHRPRRASWRRRSTRPMDLSVCFARWSRTSASSIGVTGWRDMVGWRSSR